MGRRIRAFDWAASCLGAPEGWPQALKTMVGLLLGSKQPMFIAWGRERIWLYNDAFTPILGRKHPQALGRPSKEVWSEAWEVLEPMFDRVFAGESVSIEDFTLGLDRRGQVEEAHFEFAYTPSRGEDGSVVGLFGACIETTTRVMAERRLASEMDRQRRQFLLAPGFICILGGPDHIFEFVNESYVRLLGKRDFLGRPVREAVPEAAGQGFVELLDQVYRTGERHVASQTPIDLARSEGSVLETRYLDFVYEPILDENNAVTGIFVEGFDVTESYRTLEQLHELNQTLERRVEERAAELKNIQTFYTHSSECHAILARREDGRFQYDEINPATLHLYRMTRDQVIGRTTDEIFPRDVARELDHHLSESLRSGAPYRYSRKLAGSTIEAIAAPIPTAPGEPPRLTVTARDVTERQSLEEQLRQAQKMEAVGQLTGGLAHDFNNLLQGIIGSLERAQHRIGQGRAGEADRFINAAADSANRAASLTHRLLAFSRRQTLDPRPTDANRLVAGMADLINRTVGPNIAVEVVGAVGLWPIRVDAPQLENALLNLSINSRDAMPKGGKLTIETANKWLDERAAKEREIPPGQYVSICVTDTGTGMPPDVVARAFDPFFTTKPIGQGTGLGLSMIYGFVRQSGGQVRVYTEVGMGTTMCLYLPRHIGALDEEIVETAELPDQGFGETVLIVDDEATVRMLVIEVLAENGYRILEAHDGPSAMRIIDSDQPIDLLITDVGLSGNMNGRQIADAARAKSPALRVLFITGYAENAAIGNGLLESGMEILTKPFPMTTLANKVRQMLEQRR